LANAFISYTGHAALDARLAAFFEKYLSDRQHKVFIQTKIDPGQTWPDVVDTKLKDADYLVVLLSTESSSSEMVIEEVRRGVRLKETQNHPVLIPIRLGAEVTMPYDLGAKVNRIQQLKWIKDGDENDIAAKLADVLSKGQSMPEEAVPVQPKAAALSADGATAPASGGITCPLPAFDASWLKQLDAQGGAVRLDSPFYIERGDDAVIKQRITEQGKIVLVRGSRQIGKSSLLARLMQHARDRKIRAVYIDLQAMGSAELQNLDSLMLALANELYDRLSLNNAPEDVWNKRRGAGMNMTRYLEQEVIGDRLEPVAILLDEVDRVFSHPDYCEDFFAVIRSWINAQASNPHLIWLNLVLAYSTEASMFITNQNQSPFNVGELYELADLDRASIEKLNNRHGSPVKNSADLDKLAGLVGGHPFLVRQSLYQLAKEISTFNNLIGQAANDDGPFSGHLQFYMMKLSGHTKLRQAMKSAIVSNKCPDDISFFNLRSLGLIRGSERTAVEVRCGLYGKYFGARL